MLNSQVKSTILKLIKTTSFQVNPCLYLYNTDQIFEKLKLLRHRPKNVQLFYAIKANSNCDILKFIQTTSLVEGVEIASIGELKKALKFFKPDQIIYTGPGKTTFELKNSLASRIKLINVESVVEAYRINNEAQRATLKKVPILLRINTDYYLDEALANMAGLSSKMGIDQKVFVAAFKEVKKLKTLDIKGIHVFSASGVLDYCELIKYVKYIFEYVTDLEKILNYSLSIIDFGGGFGIDYSKENKEFDVESFFNELNQLIKKYNFENKKLILELGRYIVGDAGYYVTEIIDIKDSKGKKHIVAAGGVNHLRLPRATRINQPVTIIGHSVPALYKQQPLIMEESIDIGGPLCFLEDQLGTDIYLKKAEIGDTLVISKAGAYGYSVSSLELLSHPLPPEIVLSCAEPTKLV